MGYFPIQQKCRNFQPKTPNFYKKEEENAEKIKKVANHRRKLRKYRKQRKIEQRKGIKRKIEENKEKMLQKQIQKIEGNGKNRGK